METKNLIVLIDYAIKAEKKAHELYRETAKKVTDPTGHAMLNELAGMEMEHEKNWWR